MATKKKKRSLLDTPIDEVASYKPRKEPKRLAALTGAELAGIADEWEERAKDPKQWRKVAGDDVEAGHYPVSIRFPSRMLDVIKGIAESQGVPWQTLIKRWIDEKVLEVASTHRAARTSPADSVAVVLREVDDVRNKLAILKDQLAAE